MGSVISPTLEEEIAGQRGSVSHSRSHRCTMCVLCTEAFQVLQEARGLLSGLGAQGRHPRGGDT